jgi:hypothetical protein
VPDELSAPIHAEIAAYTKTLASCYAEYGCVPISWEVSRSGPGSKSGHAHIQICPVPRGQAEDAKRLLVDEGRRDGYEFLEIGPNEDGASKMKELDLIKESGNYFLATLGDGTRLIHRIKLGERFNLQFGR